MTRSPFIVIVNNLAIVNNFSLTKKFTDVKCTLLIYRGHFDTTLNMLKQFLLKRLVGFVWKIQTARSGVMMDSVITGGSDEFLYLNMKIRIKCADL